MKNKNIKTLENKAENWLKTNRIIATKNNIAQLVILLKEHELSILRPKHIQ